MTGTDEFWTSKKRIASSIIERKDGRLEDKKFARVR
jgi:hypothetical protein